MRMHRSTLLLLVVIGGPLASLAGSGVAEAQTAGPPSGQTPGRLVITPVAYAQFDFRSFEGWSATPGTGRLARDTVEVRRVRAGVDVAWRRWTAEVSVDPMDADGTFVKDAYGEVRLGRYRVRIGQFKLPGSREYLTSARNTDFLERAGLASSLGAGRDLGVMLHGRLGGQMDYDIGVFAGDDNGERRRAGTTVAGRFEWEAGDDLVIAAQGSGGRLTAVDTDPENSLVGRMGSGFRFFDGVYVHGLRYRAGGDIEWTRGDWQFTGEFLQTREARREQGVDFDDLPAVVGNGASVSARWEFARRKDLTIRYERLGFDDAGPNAGTPSIRPRAFNLRALTAQAVTIDGSWRLYPWIQLHGDVGVERYSDLRSAPDPTRRDYLVAAARVQIEMP